MLKFIGILFLVLAPLIGSAQHFDWSRYASAINPVSATSSGTSLATDPFGNCFVAGNVNGTVALGTDTISDATGWTFLAKFNRQGDLLWQTHFKGYLDSLLVKTDHLGNCVVMAFMYGEVTVGNDTLQLQATSRNHLLAKFDGNGSLLWHRKVFFSAGYQERFFSVGPQGEVLLSGLFLDSISTGSSILPNPLSYPIPYLIKFNITGTLSVLKTFPEARTQWFNGAEADQSGNIYFTGSFTDTLRFGTLSTSGTPAPNWPFYRGSYLLKMDPQGTPTWLKNIGQHTSGWKLKLTAAGKPTMAGFVSSEIDTLQIGTLPPIVLPQDQLVTVLTQFDGNGQALWAHAHPFTNFGADLAVNAKGELYLYGKTYDTLTIGSSIIPAAPGYSYLAKFDPTGNGIWGTALPAHVAGHRPTNIGLDSTGGFLTGREYVSYQSQAGPTYAVQLYLLHFQSEANYMSGRVFQDGNSNGIPDPGEAGWPGLIVQRSPGNTITATGSNGRYQAFTGLGTNTLSLPNPPLYHTVAPVTQSASFAAYGLTDTANHFALRPIPGQQDLRVTLTRITNWVRAGFDYSYLVSYQNVGTTSLNGILSFTYDSVLSLTGSTLPVSSQTGNVLSWNLGMLTPNQKSSFQLTFHVPLSTPLNSYLLAKTQLGPLTGDLVPADNIEIDSARVRASNDPNDKTVSHISLTPDQVREKRWLTYTVRFQNTGTAPATIVRIEDQLSRNLNLSTLEVMDASHNYAWTITPTGRITFNFPNIHLPDSGNNELASHGFIKYRIRPETTLNDGSEILNTAAIYFDYNAPVITNTVRTAIEWPPYLGKGSLLLSVAPNPSQGEFELTVKNTATGPLDIQVFSTTGKLIHHIQFTTRESRGVTRELDLSRLQSGLYLLRVQQGNRQATRSIIIEK